MFEEMIAGKLIAASTTVLKRQPERIKTHASNVFFMILYFDLEKIF